MKACNHPLRTAVRGCPACDEEVFTEEQDRAQRSAKTYQKRIDEIQQALDEYDKMEKKNGRRSDEEKKIRASYRSELAQCREAITAQTKRADLAEVRARAAKEQREDMERRGEGADIFEEAAGDEFARRRAMAAEVEGEALWYERDDLSWDPEEPTTEAHDEPIDLLDRAEIPALLDHILGNVLGFAQYRINAQRDNQPLEELRARRIMSGGATFHTFGVPSVHDNRLRRSELEARQEEDPELKACSEKDEKQIFVTFSADEITVMLRFFAGNSFGSVKRAEEHMTARSSDQDDEAVDENNEQDQLAKAVQALRLHGLSWDHDADAMVPKHMPPVPQDRTLSSFSSWLREWRTAAGGGSKLVDILKSWLNQDKGFVENVRARAELYDKDTTRSYYVPSETKISTDVKAYRSKDNAPRR